MAGLTPVAPASDISELPYESGELVISLAWDEQLIDPLGCALLLRNDLDGLPALSRQVRISDLAVEPANGRPRTPSEHLVAAHARRATAAWPAT
jgi:hypothetical protein